MHCPNCGADLGDRFSCPYCGYENETAAQNQHKKEISAIYEKIAVLLHKPVEQARKITAALLLGAAALVVVFLIGLLGAFLYSKFTPDVSYKKQEAYLEQLETCYQSQDYAAMNAILENIDDAYMSVYDKYSIIGSMDKQVAYAEERALSYAQNICKSPIYADLVEYPLHNLFGVLNQCRELEEKDFVYEEEAAVLAIREHAESVLTEILRLTEDEIQQGMELQAQEKPDYSCFYEICAQRIRGDES